MSNSEPPNLRLSLANAFTWQPFTPNEWLDCNSIRRDVEKLQRTVKAAQQLVDTPEVRLTVSKFQQSGQISDRAELNRLCQGIGLSLNDGWCILADEYAWLRVAEKIASISRLADRMRCFRLLLMNYWSFPIHSFSADSPEATGFSTLRNWLHANLITFVDSGELLPTLLQKISKHSDLLSERPCEKYAESFLNSDRSEFDEIVTSLYIPDESWVHRELIIAPVRKLLQLQDESFTAKLGQLTAIIADDLTLKKYPALRTQATAMLLSRYAKCQDHPQHQQLQNLALELIGNPWVNRAAWQARVSNETGAPDEHARKMVDSWLKLRLIHDFFALLGAEYNSDERRLNYWIKFESIIDDMWFGLGQSVREDSSGKFADFTENARGRLLAVRGGGYTNNAFLMKIDRYLIIEFGVTNNACFVYKWEGLSEKFRRELSDPDLADEWDVDTLKKMHPIKSLRHQHAWEASFDDYFVALIGSQIRNLDKDAYKPNIPVTRAKTIAQSVATNVQSGAVAERSLAAIPLPNQTFATSHAKSISPPPSSTPQAKSAQPASGQSVDKGPSARSKLHKASLSQKFSKSTLSRWQQTREDQRIVEQPAFFPSELVWNAFCRAHNLQVVDGRNRPRPTGLTVYNAGEAGAQLETWGFRMSSTDIWYRD